MTCVICQEEVLEGEVLAYLECGHTFHDACNDGWIAAQIEVTDDDGHSIETKCPVCRSTLTVTRRMAYMHTFVVHTPQDGSEYGSARSVASLNFPWWPVETGVYHAATQLPDGRLSLIVDPGAWTNLMGSTLARKLATKATANGHKPTQAKLDDP